MWFPTRRPAGLGPGGWGWPSQPYGVYSGWNWAPWLFGWNGGYHPWHYGWQGWQNCRGWD